MEDDKELTDEEREKLDREIHMEIMGEIFAQEL